MKAFRTLLKTELKLTFREFSGVLFGVLLPVGIMFLLGFVYGDKTITDGSNVTLLQLGLPAVLTIGICATGLMGIPITVSNNREKKILKRFQVTPTSPFLLLSVQFIANLITAIVSALFVLGVGVVFFGYQIQGSVASCVLTYFIVAFSIYSIGILIASVAGSVKAANLLCTLVYFPMFFISGATIPFELLPKAVQRFADVMPLTQGIKILKGVSLGSSLADFSSQIILLLVVGVVCIIISVKTFRYDYKH